MRQLGKFQDSGINTHLMFRWCFLLPDRANPSLWGPWDLFQDKLTGSTLEEQTPHLVDGV